MTTFRTPATEKKYTDLIAQGILENGCRLCQIETIQAFTYWRIILNEFPYDRVASTHDMIVPLRHISELGLTEEERKELIDIKHSYINERYRYTMEAAHKNKSIPEHFHLHLITLKEE